MKKSQAFGILSNQNKTKNKIVFYAFFIFVLLEIAFLFSFVYINKSRDYNILYTERSNTNYDVYLRENEFFTDNYLGEDNTYVSSLMDYIISEFNYELDIDNSEVKYDYSYKINGLIEIKEKGNNNPLYKNTVPLLKEVKGSTTNDGILKVSENLQIDYNYFNDIAKKFVTLYKIEDSISELKVMLEIDIKGVCDQFESVQRKKTEIYLSIPLNTKTVAIDVIDNLNREGENVIHCKKDQTYNNLFLSIVIVSVLGIVVLVYRLFTLIIMGRSSEKIYEIELKKILNNYHSYIQRVSNKMDLDLDKGLTDELKMKFAYGDCQFYKLENFTDLLEIRDSINAPIIMFENTTSTATYFMILDVTNRAVYIFTLKVGKSNKKKK